MWLQGLELYFYPLLSFSNLGEVPFWERGLGVEGRGPTPTHIATASPAPHRK